MKSVSDFISKGHVGMSIALPSRVRELDRKIMLKMQPYKEICVHLDHSGFATETPSCMDDRGSYMKHASNLGSGSFFLRHLRTVNSLEQGLLKWPISTPRVDVTCKGVEY